MSHPNGRGQLRRIGWFDFVEERLQDVAPPPEGYAVSLISEGTLDHLTEGAWTDTVALGRCIVNTGYDSTPGRIKPLGPTHTVAWGDAPAPPRFACDFLEARRQLSDALEAHGAGGRVFIDATAISKSVLSAILGMLIRTRAVAGIDVAYQQVEYLYHGRRLEEVYAEGPLSHGINDITFGFSAIPYVEGKYKPGMRRHVILLCGLDFQRTLSKVRELEPAEIDIIVESEAIADPENARALNRLRQHLQVPQDRISKVPRRRAGEALKMIDAAVARGESEGLHSILVSSGGKPFSLAAALHSVLRSECPMLATIPDRVVALERKAAGLFQLYRLTDRTSLL